MCIHLKIAKKKFFDTFLSELRVPPSELRIFGRFPGNDNILKKVQNTMQNLYNIVELFILYLLIQLFRDLVQF